jgi:hypothetical protein
MNRRDALRLLATGAALPLAPPHLLAMLANARAVLGAPVAPSTLNPHQEATVRLMAEMILPKTDTPGATDVGVTEFIDLMLREWYEDLERTRFLKGLDDVDTHAQALFAKDFVECSRAQQAEILTWLGEEIAQESERNRDQPSDGSASAETPESFYSMLRRLTLTAYYTSEAGATDELHFEIIPDRYDGCAEVQSGKGGPAGQ